MAVAVALAGLLLTGCVDGKDGMDTVTGEELVDQAEQHYRDYRTVTNDVQRLIFDGPWQTDIGSYGMQPVDLGCDAGQYAFDLVRTTRVDPAAQASMRESVVAYLEDAGFDLEEQELGDGDSQSTDVIVRKQGDFSQLMVTFIANGSVLVSATTACWPGDADELGDLLFGDAVLAEGYLPREESPDDPLFFGVTPGEPSFRPGATPAP